jgi:hypothetical protein
MSWRDTIKKEETQETSIEEVPKSSWRDTIKKETTQLPEDEVTAPAIGYVAGKFVQKGIESGAEAVSKMPEKLATTLGGLTPDQVSYLQQNYKSIEGGKGISQESVDEVYSNLENLFKQKNTQANEARKLAEESLDVPLTKKLMKEAASRALPKLMDKIDTEKEAFQEVAKERVTKEVESEATRLTNLSEEKKLALQETSELAQSRAEKAAEIAVKKASPKKKLGLVKEPTIDTTEIYNKAFDEELSKALPEQQKRMTSLIKEYTDAQKRIVDLQNEYFIENEISPKVRKQIIREQQTKLASEFPSVRGYQDVRGLGSDIKKLIEPYTDVTQFEGRRAAEELRNMRKQAFGPSPTVKDEAAKALQEEVRQLMAPEGSVSDIEYKRVSNLLNQLKQAQTEGFITRKTGEVIPGNIDMGEEDLLINKFKPESVEIGQKEQQFIKQVLNPSKADLQNIDVVRGRETLENLINNPKMLDEVKQAAIKQGLLDPKKAFKFGPVDALRLTLAGGSAATGLGLFPTVLAGAYEGVKYAKTPEGAYKLATLTPRVEDVVSGVASKYPKTSKVVGGVAKLGLKAIPFGGAAIGGVAAQAAEEALSPEASGALPTTISTDEQGQPFAPFYEEKGFTPEEAVKRAEISQFQEEYGTQPKTIQQEYPSNLALEGMSDIVESPQITSQRQSLQKQKQMLEESRRLRDERRLETQKVKQLGALAPTYVEAPLKQVLKADSPAEISSIAQSMQTMPDKASQEYSRVLSQIVDAPASQKEAVLFGLNQQPAFRELLKKIKGE